MIGLQLLRSSPHLQVCWEQRGKARKRGYSQRVLLWLLAPSPSRHFVAPASTWGPIAAHGSTGEGHSDSLLGELGKLTIFTGTPHHSHTHTSPLGSAQNISRAALTFSYWQHIISDLRFLLAFLLPLRKLVPWVKWQEEINRRDICTIAGGFLACLQGCAGSRCWGISGMAVERDKGWKGGGRTMSRQATDYGVWLADFAIVFLKAWQDSVLGFFESS